MNIFSSEKKFGHMIKNIYFGPVEQKASEVEFFRFVEALGVSRNWRYQLCGADNDGSSLSI